MQEKRRKFVIFLGAILLAGIIVVGSLLWLTGSLFTGEDEPEIAEQSEEVIVETKATPEPTTVARITPEAASTQPLVQDDMSNVAGVTTTAQTGPTETALLLIALLSALGFGSSLFLIKFA